MRSGSISVFTECVIEGNAAGDFKPFILLTIMTYVHYTINMSKHPAIKLFMISLISGMLVLVVATMTFLVFYTQNAKRFAAQQNAIVNATTNTNASDETPYIEPPTVETTALNGTIIDINDSAITLQLQGFSELTSATTLSLTTTSATTYSIVDSRTPPTPGSGQTIVSQPAVRADIEIGSTVSVMVKELNDTAAIIRSVTLIQ